MSFPKSQFLIKGYKTPYRLDISDKSGGLLVYIRNEISSRYLKSLALPNDIQSIPIELRLKSQKWLIIFLYRPPSQNLCYFLNNISNLLDCYSNIERCMLIGDFNCEISNPILDNFLKEHDLFSHIKSKTCYKSLEGSCIDLILSNQKHGLQKSGTLDTGLSDFHHLIHTQLKCKFSRVPPKKVTYRCFRNFNENNFLVDLSLQLTSINTDNYDIFEETFVTTLDRHAPLKSKFIRGNEKPHVNKDLRKAIMKRSRLRNIYLRSKSRSDLLAYRKQRNYVCSLNRKTRRIYFDEIASNPTSINRNFWKICKPFFSDKHSMSEKILLVDKDEIVTSDSQTANIFNTYFNGITNKLNLKVWAPDTPIDLKVDDPVLCAIVKYSSHPSIIKIKEVFEGNSSFEFTNTDTETVHKLVMSLNCRKTTSDSISPKLLRISANVCSYTLKNCFNHSLCKANFPKRLKQACITPVFKDGDPSCVENYRPISILPTVSKVFEKIIAEQLAPFLETCFSNLLCGFRKGHSTQHALLRLLHHWQRALDDSNILGTIIMDLSKAYDCLPHDLLIAKLAAYGVNHKSLLFIYDYLSNRQHQVKIGDCFSTFLYILLGIPQGSVLGPLLFNLFLNDLLLFTREAEICNFADDNTLYASAETLDEVLSILHTEINDILRWFDTNGLAANPAKFQVMFLGTSDPLAKFDIGDISIEIKDTVKLLGIYIDNKLRFNFHVEKQCQKASNKVKALRRIRPYLSLKTAKTLCNAFIFSNFSYCPLVWMNFVKANNDKIDKIQRRALNVVYLNFTYQLNDVLSRSDGVSFHINFIWKLLEEVYKSLNSLSPSFMSELFVPKSSGYNLRRGKQLVLPTTNTVKFGLHSLSFVGCLIWDRLPKHVKESPSLNVFKSRLKLLPRNFCTCPLCKM